MSNNVEKLLARTKAVLSSMNHFDDDDAWDWGSNCPEDYLSLPLLGVGLSTPETVLRSKRGRLLSSIARDFVNANDMRVVGDALWQYNIDAGAYRQLQRPERALDAFLSPEQADQLVRRDCDEIVERLRRLSPLQREADDFNSDPTQVNCLSGVVDITTLTTAPHSPQRQFTYTVKAYLLPNEMPMNAPAFEHFCATSLDGDSAKRQLLLEIIGYCCSDSTAGKCALFLKGAPDSGKSILADFIRHLFDDTLVSSVPLHKLSDRFNKAELFGKKVNISGEIKAKKLTEITTFKMVTGGDRILAEYKGRDPFYFSPKVTLLFCGNALPGTSEADSTAAFANRLVVLLFSKTIPKEEQDKLLLEKLLVERDAIFTLAMEALHDLQARNFIFTCPKDSEAFLKSFRYSENSVRAFVDDACIVDPDSRIFNRDVILMYEAFCHANGLDVRPRQQLYDALDALPGVRACRLRIGNENCRGRVGVRFAQKGETLEHPL